MRKGGENELKPKIDFQDFESNGDSSVDLL
jgi:hypothetical protein